MSKLKDACCSQCANDNKYTVRAVLVFCLCKFWKGTQSKNAVLFPRITCRGNKNAE